ncbi:hypothetical protein FO519_005728 [Halicephalobus sp. NKZ332]|nr:hypothetical protein FO519_005728 [Halicephalobus sp. NKZ332]
MGRLQFRSNSVIHDLPKRKFFNDTSIRKANPMEVESFKENLDLFIEGIAKESDELIKERPRFVYAVSVLADPTKSGEIMKATCIKQIDSYHVVVEGGKEPVQVQKTEAFDQIIQGPSQKKMPLLEESIEHRRRTDNEIEAALKILQESKEMLDDTTLNIRFPSEVRARKARIAQNQD